MKFSRQHRTWVRSTLPLMMLLVVMIFLILFDVAEGRQNKQPKSKARRKKSRAGIGRDFSEFVYVMGAIMTCVIAPVFIFFLHSIYKDPAVPELARAGWNVFKEKIFSYLGQESSNSTSLNVTRTSSSFFRTDRQSNDCNEKNVSNDDALRLLSEKTSTSLPSIATTTATTTTTNQPYYTRSKRPGISRRYHYASKEEQQQEQLQQSPDFAPYYSSAFLRRDVVGRANNFGGERGQAQHSGFGESQRPSIFGHLNEVGGSRGGALGAGHLEEKPSSFGPVGQGGWERYDDPRGGYEETKSPRKGESKTGYGVIENAKSKGRRTRSRRVRGLKVSTGSAGTPVGLGTGEMKRVVDS